MLSELAAPDLARGMTAQVFRNQITLSPSASVRYSLGARKNPAHGRTRRTDYFFLPTSEVPFAIACRCHD